MMMKLTRIAGMVGLAAMVAGSATAAPGLIASWDFSSLPVAGAPVPASLAADATGTGATGTASVASGTVVAGALAPGSDTSDKPGVQGGLTGGDSFGSVNPPVAFLVPGSKGLNRAGSQYLGVTARNIASIEFETTGIVPTEALRLSFGARSLPNNGVPSSGETVVDVSFGSSCGATSSIGQVTLDETDQEEILFLGQAPATTGCVVLDVDGSTNQPLIDNVTLVSVPEPGMVAALGAGVLGLTGLARRRRG